MSAKNRRRKEANRAYRAAGEIYWTQEMERLINQIRNSRAIWRGVAISFICGFALLLAFYLGGVW